MQSKDFSLGDVLSLSPFAKLAVNKDATLYRGKMRFSFPEGEVSVRGAVVLTQLPNVELVFRVASSAHFVPTNATNVSCESIGVRKAGHVYHAGKGFSGRFTESVDFCHTGQGDKDDKTLRHVLFHVANMGRYSGQWFDLNGIKEWLSRATFTFGNWTVHLDELPDAHERREKIQATRGNGITNLGLLFRTDGANFSPAEAQDALEFVYWLLGFVNSVRVGVVLVRGLGDQGQVVWEDWSPPAVKMYRRGGQWYPANLMNEALSIAETCYSYWRDSDRRGWFIMAISLYCASTNNHGGTEIGLLEACIVLEMLASVVIVEEEREMSENEFRPLPASTKLEKLLTKCKIPTDIPPTLRDLTAEFAPDPRGPEAVFKIRNNVTHMRLNNREALKRRSNNAKAEAWFLCLWYIEMVLLSKFGYCGRYQNRLVTTGWEGHYDVVPWAD